MGDVDEVIQKANRIAEPGSAESNLFRQVLTATDGVAQVRQIVAKVPAGKVEITTPSPEAEEERSWTGLVIGGILVFLLVVLVVTGAVMYKFKWSSENAEPAKTTLPDKAAGETSAVPPVDGVAQSHMQAKELEEFIV